MIELLTGMGIILSIPVALYLIGLLPNLLGKKVITNFFDCVFRGLKIVVIIIAAIVIILFMYGIGSLFLTLIELTI